MEENQGPDIKNSGALFSVTTALDILRGFFWAPMNIPTEAFMKQGNSNKQVLSFLSLLFALILGCAALGSCAKKDAGTGSAEPGPARPVSIGVFIPGVMSGSPIYEMLAAGVQQAAQDYALIPINAAPTVTVIEGGFNQTEWEGRVTAMAASGSYDLIVSSNPSLPAIASAVSAKFPNQHFLLLDGELAGNPMIYTLRYNQWEQAYMAGHIAGLFIDWQEGNVFKIGLVAAQEYPVMNEIILPAYLAGAQAVNPGFKVDFRVVGNWYDAGRGAELAEDMIRNGASVILCIAGGANEGVVRAAADAGAKVVWFDTNGYSVMPETVIGSSVLYQDKAAYAATLRYLDNNLPFGTAEMVGVADGYVDFITTDYNYEHSVPQAVRDKQAALIEQIRSGALVLGK
jgi:simple sugar transport system substrate-binding protein